MILTHSLSDCLALFFFCWKNPLWPKNDQWMLTITIHYHIEYIQYISIDSRVIFFSFLFLPLFFQSRVNCIFLLILSIWTILNQWKKFNLKFKKKIFLQNLIINGIHEMSSSSLLSCVCVCVCVWWQCGKNHKEHYKIILRINIRIPQTW